MSKPTMRGWTGKPVKTWLRNIPQGQKHHQLITLTKNRGRMIADNHQADKIREGRTIDQKEMNYLRNNSAWHHVHAAKQRIILCSVL